MKNGGQSAQGTTGKLQQDRNSVPKTAVNVLESAVALVVPVGGSVRTLATPYTRKIALENVVNKMEVTGSDPAG